MKRRSLAAALLVLAAAGPAAAEPLSRAQAVARALERNPTVLRSFADRDGLRGRAKQARADALPEVSVYGTFLRYQDPGFFNSPNIDEFPPEILQAFRPIASNLWDGYGTVRQTLWSFSLGKAIRAAGYAEHLGEENVKTARQDVALRAIFAYNAHLLALEQVKVAEKVVHQKEKQLEMAQQPPRRRRRDRPRGPALRGGPRERPHDAPAPAGRGRPRPRGPERGHGRADRQADRADGHPRVPGGRGRRSRRSCARRSRAGPRCRPWPGTRRSTTRRSASTRPTCSPGSTSTAPTAGRCGTPATSSSPTTRSGASPSP